MLNTQEKKILYIVFGLFILLSILGVILFSREQVTTESQGEEQPQTTIKEPSTKEEELTNKALVYYHGNLYQETTEDVEIEGEFPVIFDIIDKIVDETTIPSHEKETNRSYIYQASIIRVEYDYLVLQLDANLYYFTLVEN